MYTIIFKKCMVGKYGNRVSVAVYGWIQEENYFFCISWQWLCHSYCGWEQLIPRGAGLAERTGCGWQLQIWNTGYFLAHSLHGNGKTSWFGKEVSPCGKMGVNAVLFKVNDLFI